MNTSRLQQQSPITVVWSPAFLSEPGSARHSSASPITTVWSNYQTSYNDFFEVYISHRNGEFITKYSNGPFDQFSSINVNHVTNHSSSSLVKSPSVTIGHKYINVLRHQLLISSKIHNGWSMAVTVLQRIASKQQIGLLHVLVPAIKGAVYINTYSNYSQPVQTNKQTNSTWTLHNYCKGVKMSTNIFIV